MQLTPTQQFPGAGLHGLVAAVNHDPFFLGCAGQVAPEFEVVEIRIGDGLAGFDFNCGNRVAIGQQAINLLRLIVLPEVRILVLAAMDTADVRTKVQTSAFGAGI